MLAGCGASPATQEAAPPPVAAADMAYIGAAPGVDREDLHRAIDPLFTDPAMAETRAVIVMKNGEIVAERYGEGYGPETRFLGWSMSKSVTAVLVGLAVGDGLLELDEPAPVAAWQRPGDPRGEITLRHLLQMRSGLNHSESADPFFTADTTRLLFLDGRDDMAAYAESQPLEADPGSKFEYSSATSIILADIVTDQLTSSNDPKIRRAAMAEYLRGRFMEPLGMPSLVAEYDARGTLIGGSLMHATARDWARFGNFLRLGGLVKGNQVVPRGWIDFMRKSSPADPAYGGHIWLNRKRAPGEGRILWPDSLPDSIFAAQGHLGQYVMVAPDQGLVVVRLGNTRDSKRDPLIDQLGRVIALY